MAKARKKQEEAAERKKREEEEEEKEMSKGISWGMEEGPGEEEEQEHQDMENNPFAETAENEILYLDDPKTALRKW